MSTDIPKEQEEKALDVNLRNSKAIDTPGMTQNTLKMRTRTGSPYKSAGWWTIRIVV